MKLFRASLVTRPCDGLSKAIKGHKTGVDKALTTAIIRPLPLLKGLGEALQGLNEDFGRPFKGLQAAIAMPLKGLLQGL